MGTSKRALANWLPWSWYFSTLADVLRPCGCGFAKLVFRLQLSPYQVVILPFPSKSSVISCAWLETGDCKIAKKTMHLAIARVRVVIAGVGLFFIFIWLCHTANKLGSDLYFHKLQFRYRFLEPLTAALLRI